MARGDFRAAVGEFRDALGAEPTDPAVKYRLAMALTAVGDRASAEPLLADFRRHNVLGTLLHRAKIEGLNDETLALRIGLACAEAGRPFEARAWLNWFIARDPLEPRAQAALRRLERAAPAGSGPPPHAPEASAASPRAGVREPNGQVTAGAPASAVGSRRDRTSAAAKAVKVATSSRAINRVDHVVETGSPVPERGKARAPTSS